MKKIIFIFFTFIYSSLAIASIDERKIDIYFANGILTSKEEAEDNADLLRETILSIQYQENKELFEKEIEKVDLAYNNTHGGALDIVESIAQKIKLPTLTDLGGLLDELHSLLTDDSHSRDLTKQVTKYKDSIKQGHKVLVVAHSQGNLFTYEAYRKLPEWMQDYFEAVSVASPGYELIKPETPRISWDNDLVAYLGLYNDFTPNKVRRVNWILQDNPLNHSIGKPSEIYVYKSQLGEIYTEGIHEYKAEEALLGRFDTNVHAFTFYMGDVLKEEIEEDGEKRKRIIINPLDDKPLLDTSAKTLIMNQINTQLNKLEAKPSQWKVLEEFEKNTYDYKITVQHKFEPSIDTMDNINVYPFNIAKKIYPVQDPFYPDDEEKFVYVKASIGGTRIIDAFLEPWEDIKEGQFYKLEGTDPVEYIQEEFLTREILNDGYERGDIEDGLKREFVHYNNTVIDKTLSLMWQNHHEDTYGKNWQEAIDYCEDLSLDGFEDWRLPSIKELQTLVNYNKHNPATEVDWKYLQYETYGSYTPGYWSFTKYNKYLDRYAWRITYYNGFIERDSFSDNNFVRCVRGLEEEHAEYERDDLGAVKDRSTGLYWQDRYDSIEVKESNWNNAIKYCDNLELASFTDWRLPTINELYSIVDFNRSSPAIDDTVFKTMGTYHYWTSTKNDASYTSSSRAIYLNYDGKNIGSNTSNSNFVRCVRGEHTNLDEELQINP